ncbi:hypothetical protein I5Q34_19790 [Streptomyces sp. AV19]|uniref:deoxynucleotide monophosphate kinase family protein n=1 Tax=Streptomyces sp. AV19 TaxID=2793068 RepID=UPI0018FE7291|nr:hypothetical protein [Streptomyces sp. AV19]MBH1936491.1 hypothetical protein [Streptomyces sp. AV19]MDG4532548.1 hypothetical protein [Streptomyces sp. AV19]
MTYRHVALLGQARAGKDSIGQRLVARHGFARLAFADPLRYMALDIDPMVGAEPTPLGALPIRLSDVVRRHGWEEAKTRPEVRRTLQRLGEAVRVHDRDYWVRLVLDKVPTADRWDLPLVVTDVRHENEADALRRRGFLLVRVVRPGGHGASGDAERAHVSETALADYPSDVTITNASSLADLYRQADALVMPR